MAAVDLCTFNHGLGIYIRILSLASHEVFLNFTTWIQSVAMFNDVTSDKLKTVPEWSFLIVLRKISLFFAEYCHGVKSVKHQKSTNFLFSEQKYVCCFDFDL